MSLKRELGVLGAAMMGLGSIMGTGVFVSLGIAAGIAGADVVLAIIVAAAVATCNALSSAQLAANHPSQRRHLRVWISLSEFVAWLLGRLDVPVRENRFCGDRRAGLRRVFRSMRTEQNVQWLVPIALGTAAAMTVVVLCGHPTFEPT